MKERRSLSRRDFLRISAGVAAGAFCAACAPAAPQPAEAEEPSKEEEFGVVPRIRDEKEIVLGDGPADKEAGAVPRERREGREITFVSFSNKAELNLPQFFSNKTISIVYGKRGGWGSLGETWTVQQALEKAVNYAQKVDQWNGAKGVLTAVNPVVRNTKPSYLENLIREAGEKGIYVMLDISGADIGKAKDIIDEYFADNVWIDIDVEHASNGRLDSSQLNAVAEYYFAKRTNANLDNPGVFAFYIFRGDAVTNKELLNRKYGEQNLVIPIFDGYSLSATQKLSRTKQVLEEYTPPWGVMEFYTRWGTSQYGDGILPKDYYRHFPVMIFASQ